jgi:8-oxo-dGTP pyrophosphatase MutT (NUDIX family)
MVDDEGSFAGAAAKEMQEELGLTIKEEELTNLTELAFGPESASESASASDADDPHAALHESQASAIYPSPGGSDEFVPLFLYEQKVPRETLQEWTGKLTGLREQGEKITLRLCKLEELWRVGGRDAKALSAWGLYEGLRREGRL